MRIFFPAARRRPLRTALCGAAVLVAVAGSLAIAFSGLFTGDRQASASANMVRSNNGTPLVDRQLAHQPGQQLARVPAPASGLPKHPVRRHGPGRSDSFSPAVAASSKDRPSAPQQSRLSVAPDEHGGQRYGSQIVSNWQSGCVDVPSANFSDFVHLQLWVCGNTGAQSWTFVNGTLRTMESKCMDVAGGSTANGAVVQIARCTSNNPAQQWVFSGAGDLVNPQANKCLDIKDRNGNRDGAALQLWDCTGQADQKWHRA
ncbi:MAG: streptogrisin [Actinoplanes sp.]|nr:streptogrisin [Actinoplanes sp.]